MVRGELERLEQAIVAQGRTPGKPAARKLARTPLLEALGRAGTQHVYGDTADAVALGALVAVGAGTLRREIDGNTANQPLVRRVVGRYLAQGDPRAWARALDAKRAGLSYEAMLCLLYAIVCGRIGNDMARAFAAGRSWEVSLQLHTDLAQRPRLARRVGHLLRRMVPSAIVKVPFSPDAPDCFLVARDLERAGIPVNFTSTFSARQAVAAALLADVARTNIFMGRLDQGLQAEHLGEHVDLEAQRALRALRREAGVKTLLIVASVHDWETLARVAGCDVFTAPLGVLRAFLEQREIGPEQIGNRLETSYADRLGVSDAVRRRLGAERLARLWRVEPELVEFLREYRETAEYRDLDDGELLRRRLEEAGFGDLFHAPDAAERAEMERGKLPRLDGRLARRVPLDTHYSLLANADFARHQREIDADVEKRLAG